MIQITQFTNANGDTIIVLPPFTQEDAGKILGINEEGTGFAWVDVSPEPPPPSFNYILLHNMVEGHTIGVDPYDYADAYGTSWHDKWLDTVLYDDSDHESYEWWDNYSDIWRNNYKQNLVDDTIGAKLIDTRKPIDFSKYNITTGTPYAIYNGDDDSTVTSLNFDLNETAFNPLNITLETWAFCRSDSYYYTSGMESLISIGSSQERKNGAWTDSFQLVIVVDANGNDEEGLSVAVAFNGIQGNYMDLFGVYEEEGDFLNTGKPFDRWLCDWHHYALSVDGTNIYFHIDGKLVGQKSLSDTITFEYSVWNPSTQKYEDQTYEGTLEGFVSQIPKWVQIGGRNWNEASLNAGFAQLAVTDSCKWTTDFEVPTVAY